MPHRLVVALALFLACLDMKSPKPFTTWLSTKSKKRGGR